MVSFQENDFLRGGRTVRPKSKLYSMTMTAVMAAILAVISPFALFLGPVPVSLCTLVICLCGYVLGGRRGTAATLVYILLGAVGMPVFSGFSGGAGQLLGPTGGYIAGYLVLAAIAGAFFDRFPARRGPQVLGMALGTAALYAMGTAWFCFQAGQGLSAALAACVLPFLPGDCLKIAAAAAVGPVLRDRLTKAGLI